MNAPFATMGPAEPQIVVFTPAMRTLVCDAIEALILLLDEIDGDADLEETGDEEPSLGSYHTGLPDLEDEHDGREASLGTTTDFNQQLAWDLGLGARDDREG